MERATRAWIGWVSFNNDMDFIHCHSLTHSRLLSQDPWRGHRGWDQPLTELSFPSLPSSLSIFLLLIPTGWVWKSHLFPIRASSDWTPPSFPASGIHQDWHGVLVSPRRTHAGVLLTSAPLVPPTLPLFCHLALPVPICLPSGLLWRVLLQFLALILS